MSFYIGFADEIVKLAGDGPLGLSKEDVLEFVKKNPGVARAGAEGFGEGAVKGVSKEVGPSAKGAVVGGLAGKAFFGRGALGALAGLGVVHRDKLISAAKKAKEKAEEAIRSKS